MAQPIPCDTCGAPDADFLVTDMNAGSTTGFCTGCYVRVGLGLAVQLLEPEEVLAAVGPIHVATRSDGPEDGKSRRPGKRTSKAAEEPEQPPERVPGPAEVEAAPQNG